MGVNKNVECKSHKIKKILISFEIEILTFFLVI